MEREKKRKEKGEGNGNEGGKEEEEEEEEGNGLSGYLSLNYIQIRHSLFLFNPMQNNDSD